MVVRELQQTVARSSSTRGVMPNRCADRQRRDCVQGMLAYGMFASQRQPDQVHPRAPPCWVQPAVWDVGATRCCGYLRVLYILMNLSMFLIHDRRANRIAS